MALAVNSIKDLKKNPVYGMMKTAAAVQRRWCNGCLYGKTTMIYSLARSLAGSYTVFSISLEGMGGSAYADEYAFCRRVCGLLYDTMFYGEVEGIPEGIREECRRMSLEEAGGVDLRVLSNFISRLCMENEKPVVLIVDEVDQAGNQEIFLAFLGMLRDKYLKRRNRPAFQSVILAGVYDVKNLKQKIRKEGGGQYNSPWNIAAKFPVKMDFSEKDIAGMLQEYEKENGTGMDIEAVARDIYANTSGYPFLVSYICKVMAETDGNCRYDAEKRRWTGAGVAEAVKIVLKEPNTLFEDMVKHLAEYPELSSMLQNILFNGWVYPYNVYNRNISIGVMFGFVVEKDGNVAVANRIFETHMYNYFLSEELLKNQEGKLVPQDKNQFLEGVSFSCI